MSNAKTSVPSDIGCSWHLSRQGETEWNQTRKFQEQSNPTLNERGRAQAHRLSAHLAGTSRVAVYASGWMTGDTYMAVNELGEASVCPKSSTHRSARRFP